MNASQRSLAAFRAMERRALAAEADLAALRAGQVVDPTPVQLTVWYGSMPESNGKENWTAILHRKGGSKADGITLDRSEYPGRVLYTADRARYLTGEKEDRPYILNYDADKRSDYVYPISASSVVEINSGV